MKRAAAAAAAGLALLVFSLGDPGRMQGLHAALSWPLLLALLLLWGAALRGALRESGVALRRLAAAHRAGIAAAVLLTAAAVSLIGDHFKVLSDEAEIAATARSLAGTRTALVFGEAFHDESGRLEPVAPRAPKRPLLLPFLASLLQPLPGSPYRHLLAVNAAALFASLLLAYALARRRLGLPGALAAMLLLFSSPLFALCARSALMDFLSTFWLFLCLALLWLHLERATPARFSLLWTSLTLLCHCRYENALFLVVIAGGAALLGHVTREHLRASIASTAAAAALLLPLLWQFLLVRGSYTRSPEASLFSTAALARNARTLAATLLGDGTPPVFSRLAPLLFLLTALALAAALASGRLRVADRRRRDFAVLAGVALLLQLLVALSHYLGDPRYTTVQRFYLPPFTLFGLAPLLWPLLSRRVAGRHLLAAAAVLLAAAYPGYRILARSSAVYAEVEAQRGFLEGRDPREVIAVSASHLPLVALGYDAVGPAWAAANAGRLLRLAAVPRPREILVFQLADLVEKRIPGDAELRTAFRLEPIGAARPFREFALRVSRALPLAPGGAP